MKLIAKPAAPTAMTVPSTWARRRPAAETASAGSIRQRASPQPMTPAANTPRSGTAWWMSGDRTTPTAIVNVAAAFSARAASSTAAVRSASSLVRLIGRTMISSIVPDSTSAATAAAAREPIAVSCKAIQNGWTSPAPSSPG